MIDRLEILASRIRYLVSRNRWSARLMGYRPVEGQGDHAGLVLIHCVQGLSFTTLFCRNYYVSIPDDLIKAARIDGAGFWRIFYRIILPLSPPPPRHPPGCGRSADRKGCPRSLRRPRAR